MAQDPDHQTAALAASCAEQLKQQGYAVLQAFLTPSQVEELQLEADTMYELAQDEQQRGASVAGATGAGTWGWEAASSCIFESIPGHRCTSELRTCCGAYQAYRSRWPLRVGVWAILFRSQLTQLATTLLGPDAVLFNDQYIIKPPGTSLSSFQWHRDSDWCRSGQMDYQPYISVWCALDDMTASNGCLVMQPGSQLPQPCSEGSAPSAAWLPASADEGQGYCCQQPQQQKHGIALEVAAGTVIVTSDTVLHCSGPNRSRHMRRAWMPQFAKGPLTWHADGSCVSLAIPLAAEPVQ